MSDDTTPQDDKAMPPASAGSPPLRLFVCSRWSYDDLERNQSWYGALLIVAVDEKAARDLFVKTEWNHEQPRMVELVPDVFGLGEARVIYDDDLR